MVLCIQKHRCEATQDVSPAYGNLALTGKTPNIHRRFPSTRQRQACMHNPRITRPIVMQVHPKQRTPGPRAKRQPSVLMLPPLPLPIHRPFNIGKPRFALLTLVLQIYEKARDPVEHPPRTITHLLRCIVPIMMKIKTLASLVAHHLREAEIVGQCNECPKE